jgi:hypothetical protein
VQAVLQGLAQDGVQHQRGEQLPRGLPAAQLKGRLTLQPQSGGLEVCRARWALLCSTPHRRVLMTYHPAIWQMFFFGTNSDQCYSGGGKVMGALLIQLSKLSNQCIK